MLRCANQLGLKARETRTRGTGWRARRCPASPPLRDGGFLLLGKASEDKILVQAPGSAAARS